MDKIAAKELLKRIETAKQEKAAFLGTSTPRTDAFVKSKANEEAMRTLAKTLLLAAGGGAAMRGFSGLKNLFKPDAEPVPSRTVDMPIVYPSNDREKKAYSRNSVPYFLPGMLLGTPLAAYGGWKAVDHLLDRQRRLKSEDELSDAKKEYEKALFESYKKGSDTVSTDEMLDRVFSVYEKSASFSDVVDTAKGLGLTYALASAPLGYMVVNKAMKKNSKRRLLEKAMRERARRQAERQPAELYAIPTPSEPPAVTEPNNESALA